MKLTNKHSYRLSVLDSPPQSLAFLALNGLIAGVFLDNEPLEDGLFVLEVAGVDDGLVAKVAEDDNGRMGEYPDTLGQLSVLQFHDRDT